MKSRKYFKIILFIVLVIGFFVSVHYNESSLISRLKNAGKKAIAEVVGVESGNKAKYFVVEFVAESGEKIQYYENCSFFNCKIFINKKFTIIYNPKKLSEHILLYRRGQFESMGLPFPDSLKWVDQYEGFFNFKNAE